MQELHAGQGPQAGTAAGRPLDAVPPLLGDGGTAVLERLVAGRPAVFLDYDGTLTPIIDDPEQALLAPAMREALAALADVCPVAVVSGRDLSRLRDFVRLDGVCYAGSHGFDIAGPPGQGLDRQFGREFLDELDAAEAALRTALGEVPGAEVERKRFSLAAHYRRVPEAARGQVHDAVARVLSGHPRLRAGAGKMVHELRPDIDWDKGHAVLWLLRSLGLEAATPVYVGDDVTDEDAFRALKGRGLGIAVRGGSHLTLADYALADTLEVERFLRLLAARLGRNGGA